MTDVLVVSANYEWWAAIDNIFASVIGEWTDAVFTEYVYCHFATEDSGR